MNAALVIRLIVGLVLAVLLVEMLVLYGAGRRSARIPRFRSLLPNFLAGLFFILALGATTLADPLPLVATLILLGGLAHAWDLSARIRGA